MWQLWERQPLTSTTRSGWPFLLCCMLATCIHSADDHANRFRDGPPHRTTLPRPTGSRPTFLDHTSRHDLPAINHLYYGYPTWSYHLLQSSHHSCPCAYNCSGHSDLQCLCSRYRATDQTLCTNWHPYILASHSKGREGPTPPPLFCLPPGSHCNYYHHHPIGFTCSAPATHTCRACSTPICRGHTADCVQCGLGPLCHFCVQPTNISGSIPFHGKDPARTDKIACTLDSTLIERSTDQRSPQTGVWLATRGVRSHSPHSASAQPR